MSNMPSSSPISCTLLFTRRRAFLLPDLPADLKVVGLHRLWAQQPWDCPTPDLVCTAHFSLHQHLRPHWLFLLCPAGSHEEPELILLDEQVADWTMLRRKSS